MNAALSAYVIEDQRRMSRARNYFAWQASLVRPELGPCVVECGSGIGNFTGELAGCRKIIALDADPACIEILKQRHPQVCALVREVGNESLADLAQFQPDSCLFINVLEHVENDARAVHDAAEILRPGGSIVILVPAFAALAGPIDRNLGHFRRYSRPQILALASQAKLNVEKFHYLNLAGFFGWWANARIFRREAQSETQIAIFDRWIVPVISRVERAVHPPFGQSIFTVLRKS